MFRAILPALALTLVHPTASALVLKKNAAPDPPAVEIETRLAPSAPPLILHRPFELIVEARWQGRLRVEAPDPPKLDGVEHINLRTLDQIDGAQTIRQYIYEYRPTRTGLIKVGSSRLTYQAADAHTEESRTVPIEPVQYSVRRAPSDALGAGTLFLLATALVIGSGSALFLARRAKNRKEEAARMVTLTPMDLLRQEADRLESLIIEGQTGEIYERLARAVRRRLNLETAPVLTNATTDQIGQALGNGHPLAPQRRAILNILNRCDAVRYAAHEPTREETQSILSTWKQVLTAPPADAGPSSGPEA